jgi:hypothetical protein
MSLCSRIQNSYYGIEEKVENGDCAERQTMRARPGQKF